MSVGRNKEGIALPHLAYVDRVPTIIDIAGFTRITEDSINNVIDMSGLQIYDWIAAKEYNEQNKPFLHMYIELYTHNLGFVASTKQVLMEHLSIYFKYFDSDYNDLKKLLGMEPLKISVLRSGTLDNYRMATGKTISRMNPPRYDIAELLRFQQEDYACLDRRCGL